MTGKEGNPRAGMYGEKQRGKPAGAGTWPAYLLTQPGLKVFPFIKQGSIHAHASSFISSHLLHCRFLRAETLWTPKPWAEQWNQWTTYYFFLNELTINSGGKIGSCVGSNGWNSEELNRLEDIIVYDRENANGWAAEEKAIHIQS